ncbi:unnamed protein product [Lymnaea stagnalis]|uniref:CHCH domain-containing protein n=1 Tax=Lymnaea stagnalis TaxID=6523 RepID=A0AAV2HHV2_LYMST
MPRGTRRGGAGGARSNTPAASPSPPRNNPRPGTSAPNSKSKSATPSGKGFGSGIGGTIAGSFLGSALGTVVGNAIASKMFAGRDPDTGTIEDRDSADSNPCKKELDYFLECAKYSGDPSYCKGASEALKKCADKNRDYFQDD